MEAISHPFLIFQLLVNVFSFGGMLFLIFMVFSSTIIDIALRNLRKPETNASVRAPSLSEFFKICTVDIYNRSGKFWYSVTTSTSPPRCFLIQGNKLLSIL